MTGGAFVALGAGFSFEAAERKAASRCRREPE